LRNPLAAIRFRAQMSMRSKEPELLDRSVKLTLEEIGKLSGVFDRLLYFAKPIQLQVENFSPAQLCIDLLSSLGPEAESASIQFVLRNSDHIEVVGDALKLLSLRCPGYPTQVVDKGQNANYSTRFRNLG
jgi:signal transduction histidine kinase